MMGRQVLSWLGMMGWHVLAWVGINGCADHVEIECWNVWLGGACAGLWVGAAGDRVARVKAVEWLELLDGGCGLR
eukprot:1283263-Alexandrium_andersonii.AAC.1